MKESLDAFVGAYVDGGTAYSFDNDIMLNWYPRRINALCPPEARLLELGVGHAITTPLFANHFSRHVVIDGSLAVIQQFQTRLPACKAHAVHSYFETFETDERFDVVVMGFVLEHVDDPRVILDRYRRFLRPGGRCFVAVPNGQSLHRRFGQAAGLLEDCLALGPGDLAFGHKRQYSVASLSDDLEATGYRIVRKEGIFLKPMTTSQLESLHLPAATIQGMCKVGIDYPELSCALLFEAVALT
ncbi:MAG: class I SAM-dependent methyltransferase [Vicinamibacteria bacterium]